MSALQIPQKAIDQQNEATSPSHTVWVRANAGSGKTHVLTERVIRLLLAGTPPAKILCLTYTTAAAQNMKARIFSRLKEWPFLDDDSLRKTLISLGHKTVDAKDLSFARRLFAQALETPGGLKIQTIHAFCLGLLQRFPLEANLSGHFSQADSTQDRALREETRQKLLIEAFSNYYKGQKTTENLSYLFECFLPEIGETGFYQFIEEVFERRYLLKALLAKIDRHSGGAEGFYQEIFSVPSLKSLYAQLESCKNFPPEHIALLKEKGKKRGNEFAGKLEALQNAPQPSSLGVKELRSLYSKVERLFYTTTHSLRATNYYYNKDILSSAPEVEKFYEKQQEKFLSLEEGYKNFLLYNLNVNLYPFIRSLIKNYEQLKRQRGLLDFDDFIYGALDLLRRSEAHLWVHYKLDQGIDHILVDEAQDSDNPQWEIIQILAQEFFSGQGQQQKERTLFAVGDEKQAIYGFRGANPKAFEENGRKIRKLLAPRPEGHSFKEIGLHFSFRSSPTILKAVDQVFSIKENYQGLSEPPEKTSHEAIRTTAGRVDIWPAFFTTPQKPSEDWLAPPVEEVRPVVGMAQAVAEHIEMLLKTKRLAGQDKPITPADIIILVSKRKASFIPTLTRCLKQKNIPVSGADRLSLTDHIAIQDLLALGQFLLQPQDDLSLACLFKSPLFCLSEKSLYDICHHREGSLWAALCSADFPDNSPEWHMVQKLKSYRAMVDFTPVFELYAHILSVDGGRAAFIGRFGKEVEDVLDEFLQACLDYQQSSYAGLQGFLEKFVQNPSTIKRDFDQNQEEIRILTVHGAKGLEAPIVFLVDFGTSFEKNKPLLYKVPDKQQDLCPVFALGEEYSSLLIKEAEQLQKEERLQESHRLLYVGLTRAKDYLIFLSLVPAQNSVDNSVKQGSWHDMLTKALKDNLKPLDYAYTAFNNGEGFCYAPHGEALLSAENTVTESSDLQNNDWEELYQALAQPVEEQEVFTMPLIPSQIGQEGQAYIDDTTWLDDQYDQNFPPALSLFQEKARSYGQVFHKILQYATKWAPEQRDLWVNTLLEQEKFSPQERDHILKTLARLWQDKQLGVYFSCEGQNEVALSGNLLIKGRTLNVVGRIDRLIVTAEKVIILDYKTGLAPKDLTSVPFNVKIQMALYAKLLESLYPNKKIEAILLYTEGAKPFSLDSFALKELFSSYAHSKEEGASL